ncbi:hypothetical protein PIB30_095585 [Stylosanthes scabra]|uniref:Uncharacterized protein n=1 Tax=Stylosanthes scabra TaxID=79078 RepID=A0ABU6YWF2_9FABA|nr:hypothetical protein [Stylosanthes scabra]
MKMKKASGPPPRRGRRRTPTHGHRPFHHHHPKPNLTAGNHHSPSVSLSPPRPRDSSSTVLRAAVFVSSFQLSRPRVQAPTSSLHLKPDTALPFLLLLGSALFLLFLLQH